MFFLLKWLENGALYAKIAHPPSFLTESVFLLILHVIIALLCNAAGIIGHLIHRSIKKERA